MFAGAGYASILGEYPVLIRCGMTSGELALMFNKQFGIDCNLHVVPLQGWARDQWYDQTKQYWIPLTPNIPTLESIIGFATTGLLQNTNLSFGRGTTRPFEVIGASWIDGPDLARKINRLEIPGLQCIYTYFCPTYSVFQDEVCSGVLLKFANREIYRPYHALIHILSILMDDYAEEISFIGTKGYDDRVGNSRFREDLLAGKSPETIWTDWNVQAAQFEEDRKPFLLY